MLQSVSSYKNSTKILKWIFVSLLSIKTVTTFFGAPSDLRVNQRYSPYFH